MAKKSAKKTTTQSTRPVGRPKKSVRELFVEEAANEALDELENSILPGPESLDLSLADRDFEESSIQEIEEKDVFIDADKKAKERLTRAKFRIYRDGVWLATREAPYSWEKLQKDYGGGFYKVMGIDRNNLFLGSQTQEVADLPNHTPNAQPQNPNARVDAAGNPLELFNVVDESRREAEMRVESQAASQTNSLATIFAGVMQSLNQSQQQMAQSSRESANQTMAMFMNMQQQAQQQQQQSQQQMMTLLTSLLTNKPTQDQGIRPLDVMKMVQDAESRAEDRTKRWYDLVEQKAEAIKEEIASVGGEKEESFTKSLIKGFLPIMSQLSQVQQAGQLQAPQQLTPEQQFAQIQEQNRRQYEAQIAEAERRNLIEKEKARRAVLAEKKKAALTAPKSEKERVTEVLYKSGAVEIIKNAIGEGVAASKAAEDALLKLEKSGLPRQTVANAYTYEDYCELAVANGLPREAIPLATEWITEFYNHVQRYKSLSPSKTVAGPNDGAKSKGEKKFVTTGTVSAPPTNSTSEKPTGARV